MWQNNAPRVREAISAIGRGASFVFEFVQLVLGVAIWSVYFGVFFVILTLARGYVLVYCWAWFVTPVFGLRPISTYEAVGLSIITNFLLPPRIGSTTGSTEEPRSKFWAMVSAVSKITAPLVGPFLLLLLSLALAQPWPNHSSGIPSAINSYNSFNKLDRQQPTRHCITTKLEATIGRPVCRVVAL